MAENTVYEELAARDTTTLDPLVPGAFASLGLEATLDVQDSTSLVQIEVSGFASDGFMDITVQRGSTTVNFFQQGRVEGGSQMAQGLLFLAYDEPGVAGNTVYTVGITNTGEDTDSTLVPTDFQFGATKEFQLGWRPFIRVTEIFVRN